MKKDNKILDQIFSDLLNLEGVKKRSDLDLMDISFGFSDDFKYPYFFLYSLDSKLNDKKEKSAAVISPDLKEEVILFSKVFELMQQNYDESGYSQLPILFETDIFEKNWSVRTCGDYYLCNNIANLTWGSFCITKSKAVATSWIKNKKEKQNEGLVKYQNDLREAKVKVKTLTDYKIPEFKKVLKDFELAQAKFNL